MEWIIGSGSPLEGETNMKLLALHSPAVMARSGWSSLLAGP